MKNKIKIEIRITTDNEGTTLIFNDFDKAILGLINEKIWSSWAGLDKLKNNLIEQTEQNEKRKSNSARKKGR